MNPSQSRFDSAVDEQAATWAARLDGDVLESSERKALDAWLAETPAHRTALSQYCQFSADLEEQLPVLVAAGAVKMPAPKKASRKILSFPRIATFTLAAAAAVAIGLWTVRPSAHVVPQVQYFATAVTQRATHTLADGTKVELSADTSLRFENTKSERLVRLGGGEALFFVSKDRSRPFTIQTPAGSVRVTGTTFNVRTDSKAGALDVTVVEGSVEVRPGEIAGTNASTLYPLVAGQHLSARADGVSVNKLSPSSLDDELAWREGQVVFNDVPLREAAARFARYHGRTINVADSVVHEKVGGRHSLEDLEGFLDALPEMAPVNVRRDTGGTVFLTQRAGN